MRLDSEFDRAGAWEGCRMPLLHRAALSRPMEWGDGSEERLAWDTVSRGGIVALIGERGTGKTQLACLLAGAVMDANHKTTRYFRADDLFDYLRSLFSKDHLDAERARRTLNLCGLLVIDEIQDRRDTDFEDHELRRLIDKRYGNGLPTVLIGNLRQDEFVKRVGPSVVSRINEVGTMIVCDWPSFRDGGA